MSGWSLWGIKAWPLCLKLAQACKPTPASGDCGVNLGHCLIAVHLLPLLIPASQLPMDVSPDILPSY